MYREIQPRIYRALRSYTSFTGRSSLPTWLLAITANVLKKEYRSRRYKRQLTARMESQEGEQLMTTEQEVLSQEVELYIQK